ncbi:MAG TPA: hypothetical protein VMB81_12620 [Candidatus Sulfotelmatobacter sp.]|nr:hypothetical protein [Candidatus Sulfotelmatobacter sp.]
MRRIDHLWQWRAFPIAAVIAATPALALAQSTVSTVQIIAPTAPPALRTEVVPPPPTPGVAVTWQSGYWNWNNNQWVWMPGHYVDTPSPQAVWEPGHWAQEPNGWLWVQGRWRMASR